MKKGCPYFFLLCCLYLACSTIYAQTENIRKRRFVKKAASREVIITKQDTTYLQGKITDEQGLPIIGATIRLLSNPNIGALVDENGHFEIKHYKLDSSDTLIVSNIGYHTIRISVNQFASHNWIILKEAAYNLDEVLIVAYGTETRRSNTGAIEKLDMRNEGIANAPSLDIGMAGRIPGVLVFQNNGAPGTGNTVRIRGATSLISSNQPMYLIDGLPVIQGRLNLYMPYVDFNAPDLINDFEPWSMESVEVLKDAAAASLLGSRGANGVILISSPKGSPGPLRVRLENYVGIQTMINRLDLLNRDQYLALMQQCQNNYPAVTSSSSSSPVLVGAYGDMIGFITRDLLQIPEGSELPDTDWQKELFKPAPISKTMLTLSGGKNKTLYSVNIGTLLQQGLRQNTDFKRYIAKLTLAQRIGQKFKIQLFAQITNTGYERIFETIGNSRSSLDRQIDRLSYLTTPLMSITNSHYSNPINQENQDWDSQLLRTTSQIAFTYEFKPELIIHARIGLDWINASSANNLLYTHRNEAFYFRSKLTQQKSVGDIRVEYIKNIRNHKFTGLLGAAYEFNQSNRDAARSRYYLTYNYHSILSYRLGDSLDFGTYPGSSKLLSYFVQGGYHYDEIIYFNTYLRVDGSSRFGSNNRFAWFPCFSLAWDISKTGKINSNWINMLKLRTSIGWAGNQDISDYAFAALYKNIPIGNTTGYSLVQQGNSNLKWENTRMINFGISWVAVKERFHFNLDIYEKYTTDLLHNKTSANSIGISSFNPVFYNGGKIRNKGIEGSLFWELLQSQKSRTWGISILISAAKNENTIEEMPSNFAYPKISNMQGDDQTFIYTNLRLKEGEAIGTIWGYIYEGVYENVETDRWPDYIQRPQNGDAKYKDINGDGIISEPDLVILGNTTPDIFGGMELNIQAYGFELKTYLTYAIGFEILNHARLLPPSPLRNGTTEWMNAWQKPGDPTDVPKIRTPFLLNAAQGSNNIEDKNYFHNSHTSSRAIEDGSFFRLKTVTLSYAFPARLLSKLKLQELKIYLQATNVFTITGYRGIDPEVSGYGGLFDIYQGVDALNYPQTKLWILGIKLSF